MTGSVWLLLLCFLTQAGWITIIITSGRIGGCVPPASRLLLLMLGGLVSSLQAVSALVRLPFPAPELVPASVNFSVFIHAGINMPCLA